MPLRYQLKHEHLNAKRWLMVLKELDSIISRLRSARTQILCFSNRGLELLTNESNVAASHLAPMEGSHDRPFPLHPLYRRERRRRLLGSKAQRFIALASLALPVPDGFVILNPTPILCPRNC